MLNLNLNNLEKKLISANNRYKLSKSAIKELRNNFRNSNILIIGAAGSIGSEFTKELRFFDFNNLFLIDKNENELTDLNRELILCFNKKKISSTRYICVDLNSFDLNNFLRANNITHYLNFAAAKHVRSEDELISSKYLFETNTKNFIKLDKIKKSKLKQVFSISSDKAVEPTSFLGVSKKLMEDRLFKFKKKNNSIIVSSVRFANVSFSNGSVLKYAYERILSKNSFGIPRKIKRYFITHKEAVSLCLHSLCKSSDGYIITPNLLTLKEPFLLESLVKKLLKNFGFKITNKKKLHLIKKNFFVKLTKSNISGQKLYEKLYENNEKILEDKINNLIFIKPNLIDFNVDFEIKKIMNASSIYSIKKRLKNLISNYTIQKNNFNIKNSL